jgi:hypothetical protein
MLKLKRTWRLLYIKLRIIVIIIGKMLIRSKLTLFIPFSIDQLP